MLSIFQHPGRKAALSRAERLPVRDRAASRAQACFSAFQLQHSDRWGCGAATISPPPRGACREPQRLPFAPDPETSTPVGPRRNRSGAARILPELVVPSSAALPSQQRELTGPRTTEVKVRVEARGRPAPGVGLALRLSEVIGVGWEEICSHTRKVEPPLRVRSRDWSCCRDHARDCVASPRPFFLAASRGQRGLLLLGRSPPASISRPLSITHTAPLIMDPGSGGGGGVGSSSGSSSSDSAPDCWDQADMEAPGPGPCGGPGGPLVAAAAVAEAQREHLSAAFSRQLNVNAKPFVPNVHAAEFVPSFLRGPAQPPPPQAGASANIHGAGSGAGDSSGKGSRLGAALRHGGKPGCEGGSNGPWGLGPSRMGWGCVMV